MQLRHAVYTYVMGIHHRYATVTYKWTYGVDMHAVYAQKDGASAYKWSPVLHTNQFCIQMEPSDGILVGSFSFHVQFLNFNSNFY